MRIEVEGKLNFEQFLNNDHLDSKEKEQLTNLFNKIVKKGHLGTSGSGRLSFLLKKLDDSSISLLHIEGHRYLLKTEQEKETEIADVNQRDPQRGKTKLHLAINTFNNENPEESLNKIRALLDDPLLDINLTDKEGCCLSSNSVNRRQSFENDF